MRNIMIIFFSFLLQDVVQQHTLAGHDYVCQYANKLHFESLKRAVLIVQK